MILKYFSATWCMPCKQFKPIVQSLCDEYKLDIEYFDIEERPDLTAKYNIKSVPCIIVIKDNYCLDTIIGNLTKEKLKERLGLK